MVNRLEYKAVGLVIMFLLCWMGYSPIACRGTVVWSDDFNDGNYDGWTTPDNSRVYDGDYGWNGSDWTADNQYLELDQEEWGIITHPSNVVYGTWSFDFRINETLSTHGVTVSIAFISNNINDLDNFTEGIWYYIQFDTITGENFYTSFGKRGAELAISDTPIPVSGWHHIVVTRNTTGGFSVYHNNSPIPIIQEVDAEIDTSEMFWLWFQRRQMIDNVVVSDTVDFPPTTDWLTIAIIGASVVVIVAVLVIILKRR